jgi:hypothetical protein
MNGVVKPFLVHGGDILNWGYIDRKEQYCLRWCLKSHYRNVWAAAWGLAMG